METTLLLAFLGLCALTCLIIGSKTRDDSGSLTSYFLGDRKLGPVALALTLVATQVGGGTIVGAANEAYSRGWMVLFYPLGVSLGLLLLGTWAGPRWRAMNLLTVAEVFEKAYRAPKLRTVASVLSIISLFIVLVGLGIAGRQFFATVGLDSLWIYLAFWLVVITYTVMGGLKAVVNTDIAQALFIGVAFLLAAIVCFSVDAPQLGEPMARSRSAMPWLDWMLMPLLFMLIEQDMGQRCFAAKDPKAIRRAAIAAAGIMMVCGTLPIALGIKAQSLGLVVPEGESVLIAVVRLLGGPAVSAVFSCAVLLAIVSTADSLLCSVSSNLVCDFAPIRRMGSRGAQLATFVVGIAAMLLSLAFSNVITLYILAYELSVSILTVPILMALYMEQPSRNAAVQSMTVGAVAFAVLKFWPQPVAGVVVALVLSALVYGGALVAERRKALVSA